jgi:hypothetical protein
MEEYYEESVEVESKVFELSELESGKSRSEKLYGADWKKWVLDKSKVPMEVMYVNCPRHAEYLMTPIKFFKSAYGYSITFQCHHIDYNDKPCLIVNQVYEALIGSKAWLRPGDILDYEPWEKALDHVQRINMQDKVNRDSDEVEDSLELTKAPPNPWNKPGTVAYIIWDVFWNKIVSDGYCTLRMLEEEYNQRASNKNAKQFYDYTVGAYPMEQWLTQRTGFVIKKFGDSYKIVGRTEGKEDREPWNSAAYRREFGFKV